MVSPRIPSKLVFFLVPALLAWIGGYSSVLAAPADPAPPCRFEGGDQKNRLVCPDLPPAVRDWLHRLMAGWPETGPAATLARANRWVENYRQLLDQLRAPDSALPDPADSAAALEQADAMAAASTLQAWLDAQEPLLAKIGATHFARGQLAELQGDDNTARRHYALAHRYQPASLNYARHYAEFLQNKNHPEQALRVYRDLLADLQTLAIDAPQTYVPVITEVLQVMADLYRQVGRPATEFDALNELFLLLKQLVNLEPARYRPRLAATLWRMAGLQDLAGKPGQALDTRDRALKIYRRLAEDDPAWRHRLFRLLRHQGEAQHEREQFEAAAQAYREALALYPDNGEWRDGPSAEEKVALLEALAMLHQQRREYPEAENYYQRALEVLRELAQTGTPAHRLLLAATLNNLGILYRNMQRPERAETAYREALALHRAPALADHPENRVGLATTLVNLGILRNAAGQPEKALAHFRRALAIYRELAGADPAHYQAYLGQILRFLVQFHANRREWDRALDYAGEAVESYRLAWQAHPADHADGLALSLVLRAGVLAQAEGNMAWICRDAREAAELAMDPGIREQALTFLRELPMGNCE